MSTDYSQDLNNTWAQVLSEYPDGLANTSYAKWKPIREFFAEVTNVPIEDVYAAGSTSRTTNLPIRLVQGGQTSRHTPIGLAVYGKDTDGRDRTRKAKSVETSCIKKIGSDTSEYDTIVIIIEEAGHLYVTTILAREGTAFGKRVQSAFPHAELKVIEHETQETPQGTLFGVAAKSESTAKSVVEHDVGADEPLNVIYYGPPGTGKTHQLFERDAPRFAGNYVIVTFHPSYSYEEFVEGIRPLPGGAGSGPTFGVTKGLFYRICQVAEQHPNIPVLLIIDEINRGNVAAIFGELITFLENDKRGISFTLPYSHEQFLIPKNVFIKASMNTADRSLASLDVALRRRFEFRYFGPEPNILKEHLADAGYGDGKVDDVDLVMLFTTINRRIIEVTDPEYQVGHAYFFDIRSMDDLRRRFARSVLPLLEEYFVSDNRQLCYVLNEDPDRNLSFDFYTKDKGQGSAAIEPNGFRAAGGALRLWRRIESAWTPATFQRVYSDVVESAKPSVEKETGSDGTDDEGQGSQQDDV